MRGEGEIKAHHETKTGAGFVCVQGGRARNGWGNLRLSGLHLDDGCLVLGLFQLCTQLLRTLFGGGETGFQQLNLRQRRRVLSPGEGEKTGVFLLELRNSAGNEWR